MKVAIIFISVVLGNVRIHADAQINARTVLSPLLKDCYREPWLINRNNLPPMSLTVLLDIIRSIEDHPGSIGDMRQISTGIIHTFRQDGIVYDPLVASTQNIVPYSPTGFPAYKNRLLLTKLIPNNQLNLPSDSISPEEKCALHHMVSSSVYLYSRSDEEWTCNHLTTSDRNARFSQYQKEQDVEIFDVNGTVDILGQQILGLSKCPIETGVVMTPWGEVAMGSTIAGISAGLEEQNVLVTDLVTVKSGFTENSYVVNNRYASTLSGDIAETAIRQGTSLHNFVIGATGGWNSTSARRHYFLHRNNDLEFTDAEIRGGIDGLVLSELGSAYVDKFPELKLSQIIDMFYSDNGVMHEARFRACNRKILVPEIAATETLVERSIGPAIALYHVSSLSGTVKLAGIQNFVNNTVNAFLRYLPQNINDPVCSDKNDQVIRPKINLILITEPLIARSQHISYIVEQLDVGKFGSSITMMHPNNGEVIIEKTFSVAQFYQEFAKVMVAQTGSLELIKVLESLQQLAIKDLMVESSQHYCGGNGTVALMLTDNIPLTSYERMKAIHVSEQIRKWAPDMRLVFATSSAFEDNVLPMLQDYSDFIPVTLSAPKEVSIILTKVTEYLKLIPRRIVNPLCGSQWLNENSGTVGFDDFVDADGVNLYKITPNYYYENNLARLLRIQSTEHGSVSVCYSRTNTFPRRNRTTTVVPDDVVCQSAVSGGEVEISLLEACNGATSIRTCPPVYITVSSTAIPIVPQCKDFGCRYPNDVKYTVIGHELGCFNSAGVNKMCNSVFLFVLIFMLRTVYIELSK